MPRSPSDCSLGVGTVRSKSDAIPPSHRPAFLGLKAKRFDLLTSTAKALQSAFGKQNDGEKKIIQHLQYMNMVDHKSDTLSLGGGGSRGILGNALAGAAAGAYVGSRSSQLFNGAAGVANVVSGLVPQ